MNIEELREFCLSIKGSSESFPFVKFGKGAENVLVFKVMNKMFAYINILPVDGCFTVWIKCDPKWAEELKTKYKGIIESGRNAGPYWNGIELDSDVSDQLLQKLILQSVEEVIKGLSKRKQTEYWGDNI